MVTDTVVGAVSDAAGKAVPARVAEQAPPEPYVPGSGAKLPAELWLVLDGYAGIACGWFAGGLACAAAAVFVFFGAVDDLGDDTGELLFVVASLVVVCIGWVCISGLLGRSRRSTRSRRASGFPGCSGGPAIHALRR